jgi:hypothetical protein
VPPKCRERLRRLAAMAANCVQCEPAFGLLRHTFQGKCAVSVPELYAADTAVAAIFIVAFAATAQRSQRSQALATMCAAGSAVTCGSSVLLGVFSRVLYTYRQTRPRATRVPTALRPVYGQAEQEAHQYDCGPNICVGGESLRSVQRPPAAEPPQHTSTQPRTSNCASGMARALAGRPYSEQLHSTRQTKLLSSHKSLCLNRPASTRP